MQTDLTILAKNNAISQVPFSQSNLPVKSNRALSNIPVKSRQKDTPVVSPINPHMLLLLLLLFLFHTPSSAEQAHRVVGLVNHDREAECQQQRNARAFCRTGDPESSTGFHEFRFVVLFGWQRRKRREREVNHNDNNNNDNNNSIDACWVSLLLLPAGIVTCFLFVRGLQGREAYRMIFCIIFLDTNVVLINLR